MKIELRRLPEVSKADLMDLMTDARLRAHMPLLNPDFDEAECDKFVASKERAWLENGYGVWAFFIDDRFVGWGGLQDEHGDPDLGLVVHPDHWGKGKALFDEVIHHAFGEMGFEYVTILLPRTRKRLAAIRQLGFEDDGHALVGKELFKRYKLTRERYRSMLGRLNRSRR